MNESILGMRQLLDDTQSLLSSGSKQDRRLAIRKLQSLAAIASTLAFTLICRRT